MKKSFLQVDNILITIAILIAILALPINPFHDNLFTAPASDSGEVLDGDDGSFVVSGGAPHPNPVPAPIPKAWSEIISTNQGLHSVNYNSPISNIAVIHDNQGNQYFFWAASKKNDLTLINEYVLFFEKRDYKDNVLIKSGQLSTMQGAEIESMKIAAATNNKDILIIWSIPTYKGSNKGDLRGLRMTLDGQLINAETYLSTGLGISAFMTPSITSDINGAYHITTTILWKDGKYHLLNYVMFYAKTNGQIPIPEQNVEKVLVWGVNYDYPVPEKEDSSYIAVDDRGGVHILWEDMKEIYRKGQGSSGNIMHAYRPNDNEQEKFEIREIRRGLSTTEATIKDINFKTDSRGLLHLAFMEDFFNGIHSNIYYIIFNKDSKVINQDIRRVSYNPPLFVQSRATLAVEYKKGVAHLFYTDFVNVQNDIIEHYTFFNNEAKEERIDLLGGPTPYYKFPFVASFNEQAEEVYLNFVDQNEIHTIHTKPALI